MSQQPPQPITQPYQHNLLELYRQHRDEIDILTDETSLFLLGLIQHVKSAHAGELSRELNLPMPLLSGKLERLTRAKFLVASATGLTITSTGALLLHQIGLGAFPPPALPASAQQPPTPPRIPPSMPSGATATGGGMVWHTVALVASVLVVGAIIVGAVILAPTLLPTPTPPTLAPAPTVPSETPPPPTLIPPTNTPLPTQTTQPTITPISPTSSPTPTATFKSPTRVPLPTPTPSGSGQIQGYVMRAADQKAIPGSRVFLNPGMGMTTLGGGYRFANLNPNTYTVDANAPNYQEQIKSVTVANGQTITLNFFLIATPLAQGTNVTLVLLMDCFDFTSAQIVACTSTHDLQFKNTSPPTLRGNTASSSSGIAVANPQNNAYESCFGKTPQFEIANITKGQNICVFTTSGRLAAIRLTAVDISPFNPSITFDWWQY